MSYYTLHCTLRQINKTKGLNHYRFIRCSSTNNLLEKGFQCVFFYLSKYSCENLVIYDSNVLLLENIQFQFKSVFTAYFSISSIFRNLAKNSYEALTA